MEKLERFLVTNVVLDIFTNLVGMLLSRIWFSRAPIVLKNEHVDYGIIPFKLFNSWFRIEGSKQMVLDAWR